jgi:uncharacterized protein (DUF58 family)
LGWFTRGTARGGADEREGTRGVPREVLARIQQLRIRTHRLVDAGLAGGYRSTFRGQGIEFEEVRPYEPGDDVRAIDWRVTARTGEPFVKRFREERQLTIHMLVDTALELDFATRGRTKRDAAAALAALIGLVGARHQDRVGLTFFGPEPGEHLHPKSDPRHVMRLVRELYGAPVTRGGSSLTKVLRGTEQALRRRRAVLFVLSDFASIADDGTEAGTTEWSETLGRLAARHDVIAARVLDKLEVELPSAGLVRLESLSGGGTPLTIDTRGARVRAAWEAWAARRTAMFTQVFQRARTEWIEVRTDRDPTEPLVALFKRRASRAGRVR